MDDHPAAISSRQGLIRLWPWFALLFVLLLVGFIRFRLLDMPLERDEGEYAYAGQLILQGIPPYELAYNMKLPGTYYVCALGMAVFGQTAAGLHTTLLVVNSLTTLFVFLLARRLFSATAGVVAAASFAIMSVSHYVLGMATHANQFVVLFAVPATLLLWKGCETGARRLIFAGGMLYGLAFLMKQQGLFFGVFGGVYLIREAIRTRNIPAAAKNIGLYAVGASLPLVCLCLMLAGYGVLGRFWFWTFTYARTYVDLVPLNVGYLSLEQHLRDSAHASAGLWLLGIAGLFLGLWDKIFRGRAIFLGLLWIFSFFATATGFFFRDHYFILVLPAFSLLIGLMVEAMPKIIPALATTPVGQIIPAGLAVLFLGWNISLQRLSFFVIPGVELDRIIYHSWLFVEAQMVSDEIRGHSSADARIAVLGSEPEIYFYSQRHSVTGYIYTYGLVEPQTNARAMQLDMIKEIESGRPQYLVFVGVESSWLLRPASDRTIFQWFGKYSPQYYQKVGIVGADTNGAVASVWADQTTNELSLPEEDFVIYQRRPAAAETPKAN